MKLKNFQVSKIIFLEMEEIDRVNDKAKFEKRIRRNY